MITKIDFFVGGNPVAWPRARAVAFNGHARIFNPKGTPIKMWKELIVLEASKHRPEKVIDGPVFMRLDFHLQRPKNHFNKHGLKIDAPIAVCKKPDLDNLIKAVMDALNACAYWKDDSQVCSIEAHKFFCNDNHPGASVGLEYAAVKQEVGHAQG